MRPLSPLDLSGTSLLAVSQRQKLLSSWIIRNKKDEKSEGARKFRSSTSEKRKIFDAHALVPVASWRSSSNLGRGDSFSGEDGSSLVTPTSRLSASSVKGFESPSLNDSGCGSDDAGTDWEFIKSYETPPFSLADPGFLSKLGDVDSILAGWSMSTLAVEEMGLFRTPKIAGFSSSCLGRGLFLLGAADSHRK